MENDADQALFDRLHPPSDAVKIPERNLVDALDGGVGPALVVAFEDEEVSVPERGDVAYADPSACGRSNA